MKHLILLLLIASSLVSTHDALAQYTFVHNKQTYQPLEGDRPLRMRWQDTVNPYTYIDLGGMSFDIYGEKFALDDTYPLAVSKWGNIELRNAKSAVIIDAFHSSIMDSISPSTKVSLDIDGMIGDRILKVQWTDMGFAGLPVEIMTSFQLWMYERTGNIEFHYGPNTLECIKEDPTLQGGYVGMFIAPADFSKISKLFWIYGDPEAPKISKLNIRAMHCPFEADVVATIIAPSTASVDAPLSRVNATGLWVKRSGSISFADAAHVTIYSMLGQQVLTVDQIDGELSLNDLAPGRYFLQYRTQGEVIRQALLIE